MGALQYEACQNVVRVTTRFQELKVHYHGQWLYFISQELHYGG